MTEGVVGSNLGKGRGNRIAELPAGNARKSNSNNINRVSANIVRGLSGRTDA